MLDIDVQVQMSGGIVAFNVVGLPDKAVAESRERVRASLHALGLGLPPKRITVNLALAEMGEGLGEAGSRHDLKDYVGNSSPRHSSLNSGPKRPQRVRLVEPVKRGDDEFGFAVRGVTTRSVQNCTLSRVGPVLGDDP